MINQYPYHTSLKSVIPHFLQFLEVELPVVVEELQSHGGHFVGVAICDLHDVLLALVQLAAAALQIRPGFLDHPPQFLQVVVAVFVDQVLQHRVRVALFLEIGLVGRDFLPRSLRLVLLGEAEASEEGSF